MFAIIVVVKVQANIIRRVERKLVDQVRGAKHHELLSLSTRVVSIGKNVSVDEDHST